jgi:hypothetical protein
MLENKMQTKLRFCFFFSIPFFMNKVQFLVQAKTRQGHKGSGGNPKQERRVISKTKKSTAHKQRHKTSQNI